MKQTLSNRVEMTLTHLALVFATLVFIVFPAVYFFSAYSYETELLQDKADRTAREIAQFVYRNPEIWAQQEHKIHDLLLQQHISWSNYVRVLDHANATVASLHSPLSGITLTRSADISHGATVLGRVEIAMDFSDVLSQMVVVFLLGLAIAFTVYSVLKTIPLRALNRTMGDLARSNIALEGEARQREHLIAELETKNAELERFTYTVSHDLKSPLITIRGFVGLLEKDAAACDHERVGQDVLQIKNATEQMQQLLDDLLELSRVGRASNPWQPVALNELVAQAVTHVAGRIEQNHVEVSIARGLPGVYGDRIQLLEVVQNLLDNAAKFTYEHATPRVEISGWQQGEEVICCIKDNGIGIEPRYHEKVFGLFERLDGNSEGTGIGLALVKRIIEVHNGRVWIESDGLGCGASFCFALPSADRLTKSMQTNATVS